MTCVVVRPSVREDIDIIAAHARAQDIAEMWASGHSTVRQALSYGFARSPECHTAFFDDHPAAMFGAVPADDGVGVVWAVLTPAVDAYPLTFLRACRPHVEAMREQFGRLVNVADARNEHVLRWLEWLGFSVHAPEPYGPENLPFCFFEWSRANV